MVAVGEPGKKRVALLIGSLSLGGAERVATSLANEMIRQGHEVLIITLTDPKEDAYYLESAVTRLGLFWPEMSRIEKLMRLGPAIIRIRKIIRDWGPTNVLSFMTLLNVILALLFPGANFTRVGSEHSYPAFSARDPILRYLRRRLYGRLDAVVALGNRSKAWLLEHTNARLVEIIPNPITDTNASRRCEVEPEQRITPGKRIILSVGRLGPEKGFDRLISIFGSVVKETDDWDLVIIGDGPLKPELILQSSSLGIADRVHLIGQVGNIDEWYRAAEIYAMTSRNEGFPMVLIEAMSHGSCVIAMDCLDGPREIILSEADGVLVPDGDLRAFEQQLLRLLNSEETRRALGSSAAESVKRLSVEQVTGQYLDLFDRCSVNKETPLQQSRFGKS